jgi:hypothetical protein
MKQKGTPQKNGVLRVGQGFHAFRHGLELLRRQPEALAQLARHVARVRDVGRVRGQDGRRRGSQLRGDGLQDLRAVAGLERLQRPRRAPRALADGLERISFV